MTFFFSKLSTIRVREGGGWVEIGLCEIFWRTQTFLRFMGGGNVNVLGYST